MDRVTMQACRACPLAATRTQVVVPDGPDDARIVIVGEAPGDNEDKEGRPFIGVAGKKLNWLLDAAGMDRTQVLITNTVMCRPPNNRDPVAVEKKACRKWLDAVLEEVSPVAVLPLGDHAVKSIAGKSVTLKSHHGRKVEGSEPLVIPMYHPAATAYNANITPIIISDFKRLATEIGRSDVLKVKHEVVREKGALNVLQDVKEFAFDFETSWVKDRVGNVDVIGWSIAVPDDNKAYFSRVPVEWIAKYLADKNVQVVAHNAQFEYQILKEKGIPFEGIWDTKLAAYVLGYPDTTLKGLVLQIFGYKMTTLEELSNGFKWGVEDIDNKSLAQYGADDAFWTLRLKDYLEDELMRTGLGYVYHNIEIPVVSHIANMMAVGVAVDGEALPVAGRALEEDLIERRSRLKEVMGDINFNSGDQKANALFNQLHWNTVSEAYERVPIIQLTESGKRPSVDGDVLELLAQQYPITQDLLEYSHVVKLKSTYVDGLEGRIHHNGRLYAHYNQAGGFEDRSSSGQEAPRTGRLSSSGPNLTNIPKHDPPKGPYIAELIRRCFIARSGYRLVVGDIAQEEFRIAAFLSQDPEMLAIIQQGKDWHGETTAEAFGRLDFTGEERFYGKTSNFSKLYGAGPAKIAAVLHLPKAVGQQLSNGFDRKYKRFIEWRAEQTELLKERGYIETFYGRRRYLPGVWSKVPSVRAEALRQGVSAIIQGTGADIGKLAIAKVGRRLDKLESQLVMFVHDELVVEALDKEVRDVVQCLRTMTDGLLGIMPLPVEIETGQNWAKATDENPHGLVASH